MILMEEVVEVRALVVVVVVVWKLVVVRFQVAVVCWDVWWSGIVKSGFEHCCGRHYVWVSI